MKLKIPQTVKIGAVPYDIYYNDYILEKLGEAAHVDSKEAKILLSPRKIESQWVCLLHEVLHAIVFEFGIEFANDEEDNIKPLSESLALFLNSLGIEPDFSDILEEKQ